MASEKEEHLCNSCFYRSECLRKLDISKITKMHHCNYYLKQDENNKDTIKEHQQLKIINNSHETENIKISCRNCNEVMDKIELNNKVFYRCKNKISKKCDINADPIYISEAYLQDTVIVSEYDDIQFIYAYHWDDNIVWIDKIKNNSIEIKLH